MIKKEQIIERYISLCELMKEATLTGDYKVNNALGKELKKIFVYFQKNPEEAKKMLPVLLVQKDIVVRTYSAAHCLELGLLIQEAEKTLKKASKEKKSGILSFNAEMTLKVWKEQGYLKF